MTAEEKKLMEEYKEKRKEYDIRLYKNRLMIKALENTLKQMDPLVEHEDWEERFERLSDLTEEQKQLAFKRLRVHGKVCDLEDKQYHEELETRYGPRESLFK